MNRVGDITASFDSFIICINICNGQLKYKTMSKILKLERPKFKY